MSEETGRRLITDLTDRPSPAKWLDDEFAFCLMTQVSNTDQWFVSYVLPLEPALTRYLRRGWRQPSDIDDLRQEVYVRVYESACSRIPPAAGPFVFAVARNLLIDRIRRSQIVSIDLMADLASLNVLSNEIEANRIVSGRQELARLQQAMLNLPAKCREVFRLRKIEGLSQRETAEHLGIAQGTVEKQVAKAMQVLASDFLTDESGSREHMDDNGRSAGGDEISSEG